MFNKMKKGRIRPTQCLLFFLWLILMFYFTLNPFLHFELLIHLLHRTWDMIQNYLVCKCNLIARCSKWQKEDVFFKELMLIYVMYSDKITLVHSYYIFHFKPPSEQKHLEQIKDVTIVFRKNGIHYR